MGIFRPTGDPIKLGTIIFPWSEWKYPRHLA